MIAAAVLTFEEGRLNAKCKMQNYEVKLTFSGERAGRLNAKCRMQNAKFKLTFIVSAGRVLAVPDRMRELM